MHYKPLHEVHTVSIPPPLPPPHFLLQDYQCRTADMSCWEEREGGRGGGGGRGKKRGEGGEERGEREGR